VVAYSQGKNTYQTTTKEKERNKRKGSLYIDYIYIPKEKKERKRKLSIFERTRLSI